MAQATGGTGRFRVDGASGVPKYRQLVDQVCRGIRDGALARGDRLPSINDLSRANGLSRDTVVKAYNRLKSMGVLAAAHGKGFSVATGRVPEALKVFLLFDALTPYKETLYEGMRSEAGGRLEFDMYFHHFRPDYVVRLLGDARGRYGHYVVMPFPDERVRRAIAALDPSRLVLLDIDVRIPGRRCAAVLQSHDDQLVAALGEAASRLRAYRSLTLVFHEDRNHPAVIKPAFRRFCRSRGLAHRIVERIEEGAPRPGDAYFVIEDGDLASLVTSARRNGLRIGRDTGILSYNDTPLKEIVDPGISVVSIDFAELGRKTVRQILDPRNARVVVEPTRFIARGSL
jgi:DNA-binding transcriptional regulator YhcF (GntR family)